MADTTGSRRGTAVRRLSVALAALIVLGALPTGAGAPLPPLDALHAGVHRSPLDGLPTDVRATLAEVDAEVAAMRAGLGADAFTPRVAALFGMDVADVAVGPASVPLPPDAAAAVAALPRDLREPIGTLLAAVTRARALLGDLPVGEVEAFLEGFRLVPEPGAASPFDVGEPGPEIVRALQHNRQAALLVAQALDRALPALRAASEARQGSPRTGQAVDGCDELDALPLLCVGSEADNTFADDALLLVSLGGDDTHLAGSGAAPFLLPDGSAYAPIAVTVNLDGDDLYVAAPSSLQPGGQALVVGSGSGYAGAVGLLVDLAGDDVHEAEAVLPPDEQVPQGQVPSSAVVAQGAGLVGTGLLFDEGGHDVYEARAASAGVPSSSGVLAQGAGAAGNVGSCHVVPSTSPPFATRPSCSVGALVDRGGGDDRYELDGGRADLPGAAFAWRMALGQGYGASTSGVLYDEGGRDTLRATVGVSTPPLEDYGSVKPTAILLAQAVGIGGHGLVLTGEGPTTYEALASSGGMAWNYQVWAQGAGFTGVGVLDDLGGDDRYRLVSELAYDRTVDVAADDVGARTISAYGGVTNSVMGQGATWSGVGVLRDHGGDDQYHALGVSSTDVHLVDDRDAGAPFRLDVEGYKSTRLIAQGAATGGRVGALVDAAGDDVYVARSLAPVSVTAEGAIAPQIVARSRFMSFIAAQGAAEFAEDGAGILADFGGTGDYFEAEGSNTVAAPAGAETLRAGNYWPPLQGAGGQSRLLALGTTPVLLATPRNGVCPASPDLRGFGTWTECQAAAVLLGTTPMSGPGSENIDTAGGDAVGHAPGATGSPAHVMLEPGTPVAASQSDRVPVTVRLTDADGAPIAGQTVHVNLQFSAPLVGVPIQWWNWWQEDAVTDAEGVGQVSLPLDVSRLGAGNVFRLAATYDGEAGRHPAYATVPFTLP